MGRPAQGWTLSSGALTWIGRHASLVTAGINADLDFVLASATARVRVRLVAERTVRATGFAPCNPLPAVAEGDIAGAGLKVKIALVGKVAAIGALATIVDEQAALPEGFCQLVVDLLPG